MHVNLCGPNRSHTTRNTIFELTNPFFGSKDCWTNSSHSSMDIKCISTCVDQNPSHTSEYRKCISVWVDLNHQRPGRTKNVCQHVLNKLITFQPGPNQSLASGDTKYISTCVDQTPPTNTKKKTSCFDQSIPLPLEETKCTLTCVPKPIQYNRGNKVYLNLWWPKSYHACEDTKCISTCQRGQKMHHNMSWLILSHASEDTKCISTYVGQTLPCQRRKKRISTCVEQTSLMPTKKSNVSQIVLTKPIPYLRGH